jgi:phospholipase/carboxylesterase
MNRLALGGSSECADCTIQDISRLFSGPSRARFETFVPLHYERNYAYPFLIWLHDIGDSEEDLRTVMPRLSLRNYIAASPRGPRLSQGGCGLFGWEQTPRGIEHARDRIDYCKRRVLDRYHIAGHKVFLAGRGQGGTMALRVALSNPTEFAGAASLHGPFPTGQMPLSCLRSARRLPLFIAQGRRSAGYTEERFCADLRLIHCAGMSLMLRQYPSADELPACLLRDLNAWLMGLVTETSEPSRSTQHSPSQGELN